MRKSRMLQVSIHKSNIGQVVLILVLLTVVGLTIGLSLVSRTTTDVRISSQIEQSQRAFSAAEAGIENALQGAVVGGPTGTVSLPGATAEYDVSQLGGSTSTYSLPLTSAGEIQTIWLIGHSDDGQIDELASSYPYNSTFDLCWGTVEGVIPALAVGLIYSEGGVYKISKAAFDPDVSRSNNFTQVTDKSGSYCDGNYQYRYVINPNSVFSVSSSGKLIALTVKPVYESSGIAIKPSSPLFPIQGKQIVSVGQTDTGVIRKIRVIQEYKSLPNLFNYTYCTEGS